MPKLSIIMPVYNTAKFLKRSIDSVLCQDFSDFELILVNDGSKDNSLEICLQYEKKDNRIKVIDKENGGAGSARNAGLEIAQGEYIAFPDSDDWIDPQAYSYCISIMEKKNLDLLLFGSLNTMYDENENVLDVKKGRTENIYLGTKEECRKKWAWLVGNLPMDGPSNKIYKSSVIKKNGVRFPDLRRMQDGVFNMRYFDKINSFEAVDKYFYHFTQHPSEYQRKKMPDKFIDCAIFYHKTAIDMLRSWGELTEENELILGRWFSETVMVAEFEYLPIGGRSFKTIYSHIKQINNMEYVHNFYKRYAKINKDIMKKERAIKDRWNLLLTALTVNGK